MKEQAKLIEASTSGKPYMLHFLSREAADEEKKEIEKELARWKEVVKQRDVQLIEKDKQIAGLENQSECFLLGIEPIYKLCLFDFPDTLLNRELQAEVERAKTLKVKNSPRSEYQGPRTAMPDIKDPLVSAVHRLYEDLTNLLILRVTLQKSQWPGMPDDRLFDCIINFPQNGNKSRSLHFVWKEKPLILDRSAFHLAGAPRQRPKCRPDGPNEGPTTAEGSISTCRP